MNRKKFLNHGLKKILVDFSQTQVGQLIDQRLQAMANLLAPQELVHFPPHDIKNSIEVRAKESLEKPSKVQKRVKGGAYYPRPPGALPEASLFERACTDCGECQKACPHHAIQFEHDSGPFLNPNEIACQLCEGFPCITSCPEDALLPLKKGYLPKLGQAQLLEEHCINWESDGDCRQCEENCPVPQAIYFSQNLPDFTSFCTGCGICRTHCPASPVAIEICTEASP